MSDEKVSLGVFRWMVFACGTLSALFFLFAFGPKIMSVLRGADPLLSPGQRDAFDRSLAL